jgi:formylglycine-generating enzyme required for sulfatase activity
MGRTLTGMVWRKDSRPLLFFRGGSWKSKPAMLRAATRGGAPPEQRAPTVGFRCAKAGL